MKAPSFADYREQVEAALVYAGKSHTFEDVFAAIKRGEMQCWLGPASIIVTELVKYPQHTVLNMFLAGGKMAELELMTPTVLAWGKHMGCKRATLSGRRGWARSFLTRSGAWKPSLVVLETSLDGQE